MSQPTTQEVTASLHPGLQKWISESGWHELTPIQRKAIPAILDGADCILEAPTAGGKTEAVLFPVLTRAAQLEEPGVKVLYVAPLRALLNNIELRGITYASACSLHAFKWHGDVDQKEKIRSMVEMPDLLMTTPESLEAILLRKSGWQNLFKPLVSVVLDEAHNFASGDRGGHLLSVLERIETACESPPQRIALTATIGNPSELLKWLAGTRRNTGTRIHVTADPPERDFLIKHFDSEVENEETLPEDRAQFRRIRSLHALLPHNKTIVFTTSRRATESYTKAIQEFGRASPGIKLRLRTHHSAVSKYYREQAEQLIQIGSETGLDAILSTCTLELGIDIGSLDRIIQMDALSSPSAFLQRVGRTGRRPGKSQFFRGLTIKREGLLLLSATVSLGSSGKSEAILFPTRAFHLLAHQLICLSLQSFGITQLEAWEVLKGAYCFSGITEDEFDQLVGYMCNVDYLRLDGGLLISGDQTEREFLHSGWRRLFAVFETAPLYDVFHAKNHVGTLDASFVEVLKPPFLFILAGKRWNAEKVDHKTHKVFAEPAARGNAPAWVSFGGPDVPYETAQEAGRIVHEESPPAFLDSEAQSSFVDLQRTLGTTPWRPLSFVTTIHHERKATIETYAGDKINRTLAQLALANGAKKTVSNYREVTINDQLPSVDAFGIKLRDLFSRLRDGDLQSNSQLELFLLSIQRPIRFSPFSACVPQDLSAATLIERNLDCRGLLGLMRQVQLQEIVR